MKKIIILGSCGSIGLQSLDIIKRNKDKYKVVGISVGRNLEKAKSVIKECDPEIVCTRREEDIDVLKAEFPNKEYVFGDDGLITLAKYKENEDIILENALVGSVGVMPTYESIKIKRNVLLANKETLVCAGDIIMQKAKENGVTIFPIDSEHSAIFQCLVGEKKNQVKRLIITCSGGAFRDKKTSELEFVTKADALKHPSWLMGEKITIDCATMMNKGFEVIEAHHLFDMPYSKIDVVIHKESIIHSLVEYVDSSIKAQIGCPDMRIPISYALSYPDRFVFDNPLDLLNKNLTFLPVDNEKYPCFSLALECANKGGVYPCVLNAANEIAVGLFLDGKIKFTDIYKLVYKAICENEYSGDITIETLINLDNQVKEKMRREYI